MIIKPLFKNSLYLFVIICFLFFSAHSVLALSGYKAENETILKKNIYSSRHITINDRIYFVMISNEGGDDYNIYKDLHFRIFNKDFQDIKSIKLNNLGIKPYYNFAYNEVNNEIGIVWSEGQQPYSDIFYQTYNISQGKMSDKQKINEENNFFGLETRHNDDPDLAYNEKGEALIIWRMADENNWNGYIYGQKIDKEGNNFILEDIVKQYISSNNPSIGFLEGTFLSVWKRNHKLYYKIINQEEFDKNQYNIDFSLLDPNNASQRKGKIISGSNEYIVTYEDFREYEENGITLRYLTLNKKGEKTSSKKIGGMKHYRSSESVLFDKNIYSVIAGHELVSSDDDIWKIYLYKTDLQTGETTSGLIKQFPKEAVNRRPAISADNAGLLVTWIEKEGSSFNLVGKEYIANKAVTNICEEGDWSYLLSPQQCPESEVQTKYWTKTSDCEDGVSHPESEEVSCEYQEDVPVCTESAWEYTLTPQECPESGLHYKDWQLKEDINCVGGVRKPDREIIECDYNPSVSKCTESDWTFNLSPSTCPKQETQTKRWEKIGNCQGGVTYPKEETIRCNYQKTIFEIKNLAFYQKLKGKIILRTEQDGEAYYIKPKDQSMYSLGRPAEAFNVMRDQGVGITTQELNQIPVGLSSLSGQDSDNDGLSDIFEDAIGTNKNNIDTDGDGFSDRQELEGDYDPTKTSGARLNIDSNFANNQKGKILLQVEGNGEAWYINPEDGQRYFLGRPADAFEVMRSLGLGISNEDFEKLKY